MSESWVRLWAGTATDPKFRLVARRAGQPLTNVLAAFMLLMLEANEADERGSIAHVGADVLAAALDMEEIAAEAILEAMQGRLIVDGRLSGWDKRQPCRNDEGHYRTGALSAAERKRRQRDRQRNESIVTTGHDVSRDVTTCHAPEAEAEAEVIPTHSSDPQRYHSEPRVPARSGETPEQREARVAIAVALRREGVPANADHPRLVEWARDGVTTPVALQALAIARTRKRDGPVPVAYLDPIIRDLISPNTTGAHHASRRYSETPYERIMRLNGQPNTSTGRTFDAAAVH